ncbi:hypothetical protein [Klebsiella pneumoniae]|uniref:hypothetical protein n=2 Tax=Klebsiella pneumoniae TaxID=573 RepID=UPI001D18137D|nr:hypothetical protein [Klebsiella pneumoniae]
MAELNPPLGTTTPEIFLDNVKRADELVNGPAGTVNDRGGEPLDTWRQMMAKNDEVRQNLIPLSKQYATLAAAQADIANIPVGSTTYYRSPDDSALAVEVINNAGTLQPTGRKMPSQKTVDDLLKHVETTNLIFQLVDILGYRQFYALTSGEFGTAKTIIKPDGIELEGYSLTVSDDNGIYIENILGQRVVLVDEYGTVAPRSLRAARDGSFGTDAAMVSGNGLNFNSGGSRIDITGPEFLKVSDFLGRSKTIIDASGNLVGGGSGGGITLQDRINILNAENLNYYSKVRSRYNADIERLVFTLSMIIWYGQSLSTNQEGYPALSKTPYSNLGNLMLGNSPRPNTRTGAGFTPVGSAILNPLKAVVQSGDGSYVMSDADVAALPAGSGNEGEGAVAAVNMLRTLFLRQVALLTDPSRLLVLASCGVNGRTVEALSRGADPELYNRIREAVSKIKAIADGESKTFGIGAFCFLQGEWNYNPGYGGDYTREGYKAKVRQLYSDVIADFAQDRDRLRCSPIRLAALTPLIPMSWRSAWRSWIWQRRVGTSMASAHRIHSPIRIAGT